VSLNISVSEEEAYILKSFAGSKSMGFSEWARQVMFQAVGKQIPTRG
jgi:hypothetical protein